jgi:hypothetical protein
MPLAFKASPLTCFRGKWDRTRATCFQGKCQVHCTSGATLHYWRDSTVNRKLDESKSFNGVVYTSARIHLERATRFAWALVGIYLLWCLTVPNAFQPGPSDPSVVSCRNDESFLPSEKAIVPSSSLIFICLAPTGCSKNHYHKWESIPCRLLSRQARLLAFEASGIEPE